MDFRYFINTCSVGRKQMTNLKFHLFTFLLFASTCGWGQNSFTAKLLKLEIKQKPFANYVDSNGKTIGCDWNLECERFSVVFYSVGVNQTKKEIRLKGRTYLPSHSRVNLIDKKKYGDTVGLFSVHIFLAKPFKQTLIQVPEMSFSSADPDEVGYKKFPFREGDFDIVLKVEKGTRLYFVGYNHVLKEYNIGELIK